MTDGISDEAIDNIRKAIVREVLNDKQAHHSDLDALLQTTQMDVPTEDEIRELLTDDYGAVNHE